MALGVVILVVALCIRCTIGRQWCGRCGRSWRNKRPMDSLSMAMLLLLLLLGV